MPHLARTVLPTLIVAAACAWPCWHGPAGRDTARAAAQPAPPEVSFDAGDGTVALKVGGTVVGTYVYADPVVTRPHFRNLLAPGGTPVTRAHPPVAGRDATDHADMHPGAWLAFADVGGADVWRNKARVDHVKFAAQPEAGPGRGTFAVVNRYIDGDRVVCEETCRYTLAVRPAGYLLVCDSTFRAIDGELTFGDQEEMGFGVRVATGITVKPGGGRIVDSEGRENEAGVWGKRAAWVDYSGTIDGSRVGVMLIPDPANAHPSRFHVRDYGLMAANPFGRKAFGVADEGLVVVPAGTEYRLRFAVLLHATKPDGQLDHKAAYEDGLRFFRDAPSPE